MSNSVDEFVDFFDFTHFNYQLKTSIIFKGVQMDRQIHTEAYELTVNTSMSSLVAHAVQWSMTFLYTSGLSMAPEGEFYPEGKWAVVQLG